LRSVYFANLLGNLQLGLLLLSGFDVKNVTSLKHKLLFFCPLLAKNPM